MSRSTPRIAALPSNRTVWKFGPLHLQANVIEMPEGAQVLHVAFQKDDLWAWALVDPAAKKIQRRLGVIPTGSDNLPSDGLIYEYVGTAHNPWGLVFHVFEAREETVSDFMAAFR